MGRCCCNIGYPITDDNFGAWINPRIACNRRQECFCKTNNSLIDLNHSGMLDAAMLQHAPKHASVTCPYDENAFSRAMLKKRHMRNHFLVDELICFGNLDYTIEQ